MSTHTLAIILSTIIGAAGWFYLFNSRAAHNLANVEQQRINRARIVLRRGGGVVMLVLAVAIYLGIVGLDPQYQPVRFALDWLVITLLLMAMVVLAMIDLRLTMRITRQKDI